ncbi:hypothetical protein C8R43DRAFT_412598 [Mycena crocata]|nr:hypothetical protein C8R43DRAFT_412598 [Mycena crocata]
MENCDICLACGKDTDGRAYCNVVCETGDITSPSLSSASSAFSSPHLQYAHGQDVPALVPSALGRALRAYTAHDRYSASSSSASSTSWSVATDDDSEFDQLDFDGAPIHPQALSYARRPSGTNNRSTYPHLHRRTSSASSSTNLCLPQSAPGEATFDRFLAPDDDDYVSDCDLVSEDPARPHTATITAGPAKARRKRNRASLPAYFSMLQIDSNPSSAAAIPPRASPISSSSGNTLAARPSPPTPKLGLMASLVAAHAPTSPTHHQTPRGRRRESAVSPRRRPSDSHSRSPSPARRRDSNDKVADWSSGLAPRGRAVRRNSSPPAKMLGSPRFMDAPPLLVADLAPPVRPFAQPLTDRSRSGRSGSGSGSRARTRGRARVEELDGPRSPERPGFGHGRSGLVGRARRGAEGEWTGLGVVPL